MANRRKKVNVERKENNLYTYVMWVKILLLIYQITLKTSQKQRNLRFCHDKMKTVCNAFDGLLKCAKRIHYAKSAMGNFSIIVTEKITNLSNEYANYSIYQY